MPMLLLFSVSALISLWMDFLSVSLFVFSLQFCVLSFFTPSTNKKPLNKFNQPKKGKKSRKKNHTEMREDLGQQAKKQQQNFSDTYIVS